MSGPLPSQPPPAPSAIPDHGAGAAALLALRSGEAPNAPLDLRGVRWIGEDLRGLQLAGADLSGADLSHADLSEANLLGTRLAGATLFEANLTRAELAGADLCGANLDGAQLDHAGLGHARLEGASLRNVNLVSATLSGADLRGADLNASKLDRIRGHETCWEDADLSRCRLAHADLHCGRVAGACFDGANLRGATLSRLTGYDEASWIGVDLREIDFTGAYLLRRFILDQNFLDEFRRQSRWTNLLYGVWKATSDCGRSVLRWGLCTLGVVLLFTVLYSLVDMDYGSYPTPLSPLYGSVVTLTTLGYGDVLPKSTTAQVIVMCEVVTGYVMLGGLLSIFSSKMATRAD